MENKDKLTALRVGVFGHQNSAHFDDKALAWIADFGKILATAHTVLYTGGGGGVMLEIRKAYSLFGKNVVSVCPENELSEQPYLGFPILSGQGKVGRVHLLTQSIDIGFAIGGGAGTLMEIAACYLLNKPVVVIDGFQKEHDPVIPKFLTRTFQEEFAGHAVLCGYLDAKKHPKSLIKVCDRSFSPQEVFDLGKDCVKRGKKTQPD